MGRSSSRRHDAQRIRRGRRGVASIVGALLVLLIALVAFTLVFTEAVPSWMAQDEVALEQSVQASFAALQATVDLQDALGSPHTGLTSVSLTSGAVPLFAQPTRGSLAFDGASLSTFIDVRVDAGPGGTGTFATHGSLGQVSAVLSNRYVPSQTIRFESGAVFVAGSTSAARLLYPPLFSLDGSSGNRSLAFTIVSMQGATHGTSAGGTQQIADTIASVNRTASHGAPTSAGGYRPLAILIEIGSYNVCAWGSYFAGALAEAGVATANYTLSAPGFCGGPQAGFGIVTLSLDSISFATVSWLTVTVSLGGG